MITCNMEREPHLPPKKKLVNYDELYRLYLVFKGSILQLLQSPAELIGTRGAFCTTTDTIDLRNHIVDLLATNQLTDTLQIAIATSQEEHLLDDIVLIGSDVDQL